MITYLETCYPFAKVEEMSNGVDYKQEAREYEERSRIIFKKVRKCSNNMDKINKLLDSFDDEDYYRLNTYNVKYPTTLLSYAIGNASPNLIEALHSRYDEIIDDDDYEEALFKQLLFNVIDSNKRAILKIQSLLGDSFDIMRQVDDCSLNIFEFGIVYNTKILDFLLTLPRLSEYSVDKILLLALYSDCIQDTDKYATVLLKLVKNMPPSSDFMNAYFEKKALEACMHGPLFEEIEEHLLVKGISNHFSECEIPIKMAKLWAQKLEYLEPFIPLMDKFIVNIVLDPSQAVFDFMNFIKKLHQDTHEEVTNNNDNWVIDFNFDDKEESCDEEEEDNKYYFSDELPLWKPLTSNYTNIEDRDDWSWPIDDTAEEAEYSWGCEYDLEKNCWF